MSLEGFICFHPQMLCNKGFQDVLWTGWSLNAVLFIYYFKLDCGVVKKRMKICFFCARIMSVALSPSGYIVNLVKFHPSQKEMKSQGAGEDKGEDGKCEWREECECGTTSTLNTGQTANAAVVGG